jgi:two-component system, NtrC family, nitrogen regulation sensor histidine kinase NtrY
MLRTKREFKKRKREIFSIGFLAFLFVLLAWFEFRVFLTSQDLPFEYSVFFFGLVNFNLVLLLLLFFLIFRNLFKAFIEKKRGMAGSSLRSRLVLTFFIFSSVPTILMFFVSVIYINSSFDKWFSEKITTVMKGALEVTTHFYTDTKKRNFFSAHMIAQKLQYAGNRADVQFVLRQQQQLYNLDAIEYYTDVLDERLQVMSDDRTLPEVPRASVEFLEKGLKQHNEASTVHQYTQGNLIRAMVPIKGRDAVVIVSTYVPLSLMNRMNTIASVYEDLKGSKNPIQYPLKSIYIVILVLMTLVILFCATWFGFYMAQHLSSALSQLGQATRRVARGDYRPVSLSHGEQEVVELADNFNLMVAQLDKSQTEVNRANQSLQSTLSHLDERSRYIEVVLSNVSTGVISLDKDDLVTTVNDRAALLFKVGSQNYVGKSLKEVIGEKYYEVYRQLLLNMSQYQLFKMTRQMEIEINGTEIPCLFTISRLNDERGNELGKVIGFDDLTDVFNAQKIEAWKEVARRIAHEIKNPLTPIKLSAQRLQKKFGEQINDEAFRTCIDMIISQTDEMKKLVNEFSQYARMPMLNKEVSDLNTLTLNVVDLYQEAYKKIKFKTDFDPTLQSFSFDQDQIKRVLINLMENALAALDGIESPELSFQTRLDTKHKTVSLIVSDNGIGLPDGKYAKLFEPYYSTKQSGSGLGLAIVHKIIEEHGGIIQASANLPQGLSFKVELPYK